MSKNSFLFLKIVEASFCGPGNWPYPIWICNVNDDTCFFLTNALPPSWTMKLTES